MSPERIRGEAYGINSDVWAAGCVLFEAFTGLPAYQEDSIISLLDSICRRVPQLTEAQSHFMDPALLQVLGDCFEMDARARKGALQLVDHHPCLGPGAQGFEMRRAAMKQAVVAATFN
jgi:serine/threonine protein kinase